MSVPNFCFLACLEVARLVRLARLARLALLFWSHCMNLAMPREINLNPLVWKEVFKQTCHRDLVVFLWPGVTVRFTLFTGLIKLFEIKTHPGPENLVFRLH